MLAALVQLCSGDDPAANLGVTEGLVREAAATGRELDRDARGAPTWSRPAGRARRAMLATEEADPTLARLRAVTAGLGIWLVIGSLALKTGDADGRFANRSFLIGPDGGIRARYDKIHMFDVELDGGEAYRESAGFRPGDRAVVAHGGRGADRAQRLLRHALRRALPRARQSWRRGADDPGRLHRSHRAGALAHAAARPRDRDRLLRARPGAIGHAMPSAEGAARRTYGHSLAVAPWGEVIAEADEDIGATLVELDLAQVAARPRDGAGAAARSCLRAAGSAVNVRPEPRSDDHRLLQRDRDDRAARPQPA